MKINNFRGDLTDISAEKEALLPAFPVCCSTTWNMWICCFVVYQRTIECYLQERSLFFAEEVKCCANCLAGQSQVVPWLPRAAWYTSSVNVTETCALSMALAGVCLFPFYHKVFPDLCTWHQ